MKYLKVGLLAMCLYGITGIPNVNAQVTPTANQAATTSGESQVKTPSKFERAQRLDEMRYRHLWIAYGLIWFLVFFFMFRPHQLGRETSGELDELKRRLAELERSDGTSS